MQVSPDTDVVSEIELHAARGRLLFLLDGLDEITGVASLSTLSPRCSPEEVLSPLELTQALLCGRLARGSHIIVTSRPHTLTYLQVQSLAGEDTVPRSPVTSQKVEQRVVSAAASNISSQSIKTEVARGCRLNHSVMLSTFPCFRYSLGENNYMDYVKIYL